MKKVSVKTYRKGEKWLIHLTVTAAILAAAAVGTRAAVGGIKQCTAARLGKRIEAAGSHACLGCHDGTMASNVIPSADRSSPLWRFGQHPALISYADAYRRDPGGLIPPGQLDPRIRLENGMIGCITCHSPESATLASRAAAGAEHDFCLSCHIR